MMHRKMLSAAFILQKPSIISSRNKLLTESVGVWLLALGACFRVFRARYYKSAEQHRNNKIQEREDDQCRKNRCRSELKFARRRSDGKKNYREGYCKNRIMDYVFQITGKLIEREYKFRPADH